MVDDLNVKRNFRVAYYDKVGFRGIGEKALNAILKDDVVDRKKLENFCIRYPVQAGYRFLIWKVLLDILPIHQQSHEFVMSQRSEQYHDLHHALEVMTFINDTTSLSDVYLKMYQLEQGHLCCGFEDEDWHEVFLSIATSVIDMIDSPVDGYWLTVGLHTFFAKLNIGSSNNGFYEIIFNVMKRENKKLFTHLDNLGFFPSNVIDLWHQRCFASPLCGSGCLEKIWDILLGGAIRILPYVSAHVLLALERSLVQSKSIAQVSECLSAKTSITEEVASLACHKAIESWKKYENII